jgi:outer membrane biosynthesis protein TonB
VDTDVLPARQEPPAKEQGVSTVADVLLGDNIPDLVKGRRPVWPPLARLGNAAGEVVVRFSVDLAGRVTVHSVEGPDMLKVAAEQAVGSWVFRRTAIDRVPLVATFKYGADRTFAKVDRVVAP